jgi:predicted transposase YbfD/YdcC
MRLAPKKTAQTIIDSNNDYLGALKGNQSGLLNAVTANFQAQATSQQIDKGHGRVEKRTVSICENLKGIPDFPGLKTLIRVHSERRVNRAGMIEIRYYVASFSDTATAFAARIRGYWGVENKVHYVRDVTQGEDASRIRTPPLVQIWAVARNFTLNLYRAHGSKNMAQTQRFSGFGLSTLKTLFRME